MAVQSINNLKEKPKKKKKDIFNYVYPYNSLGLSSTKDYSGRLVVVHLRH